MESSVSCVSIDEQSFVAVKLRGVSATEQRQPIHLLFVIDISDSMSDTDSTSQSTTSKLEHVKQSMRFLLPLLLPTDSLSLISFGDDATVHIDNQVATPEGKALVEHTITQLKTDGCTNMSAGLLAMRDVAQRTAPHQKPGALLLTDGMANMGISNGTALCRLAEDLLSSVSNLTLTTVGYGLNHDAHILQELAQLGSGSYNIVSNKEHVASTLGDVFGGLTSVVAQLVSIKVPEGYTPLTHLKWKPAQRTLTVGDLYAENEVIVLFLVAAAAAAAASAVETIQVSAVTMPSLESITQTPIPEPGETTKEILLAYYRYHVSKLLQSFATHDEDTSIIRSKAEALQAKLRAVSFAEDILIQMMLDDLEHVLENPFTGIQSRQTAGSLRQTTMLQHAAFLSMGRGLRSDITEEEEVLSQGRALAFGEENPYLHRTTAHFGSQDPEDTTESPSLSVPLSRTRSNALNAVASPFSNRSQLRATASMRTASQSQRDS